MPMVESLWNDEEAAGYPGELGVRVYTSRLLGRDKSLVLHGGGNTSVKIRETNRFGDEEEILYVKGSGWDLETIEAAGFSPVRLGPAARLATLPRLSAHAVRRGHPARDSAFQVRRPYPRRRGGHPHQLPRRRGADPRGLRRYG